MRAQTAFGLSRIGQIAVRVKRIDRAVAFYRDTLGVPFLFNVPTMAFFRDPDHNTLALMSRKPRA